MRARGSRSSLTLLLAAFLGACATTQLSLAEAEPSLTAAEAHVVKGEWEQAIDVLAPLAGEACPKRWRDRRDLALATAYQGIAEHWEAYLVLEQFPDLYPHSELRPVVVEKVWELGDALVRSDRGFLFFWSDRRAGQTVLEHLVTRHPDTARLADALRILGDMAFEDDNHELAQQRYRQLMLDRPESEWVSYAQFRFAMSIVASIEGPEYDLERMEHGERELREFLATTPENPEFVRIASAAVAQLVAWRFERHLTIAAYYRRIDNPPGELHHLEIAAGDEFATAPGHADAKAARDAARLEAPAAQPDAAQPGGSQ